MKRQKRRNAVKKALLLGHQQVICCLESGPEHHAHLIGYILPSRELRLRVCAKVRTFSKFQEVGMNRWARWNGFFPLGTTLLASISCDSELNRR